MKNKGLCQIVNISNKVSNSSVKDKSSVSHMSFCYGYYFDYPINIFRCMETIRRFSDGFWSLEYCWYSSFIFGALGPAQELTYGQDGVQYKRSSVRKWETSSEVTLIFLTTKRRKWHGGFFVCVIVFTKFQTKLSFYP